MRTSVPGILRTAALSALLAIAACESGVEPAPDVSTVEVTTETELMASAGSALGVVPGVRATDALGAPVPGVEVRFTVASGGGSVQGGETRTDAEGIARVGSWTLGPQAGEQTLRAEVRGGPTVIIRAMAEAGPPAAVRVVGGDGQSGVAGDPLPVEPAVRVEDAHGNPVAGAQVVFAAQAGGAVEAGELVSDSSGRAQPGSWTLGPLAGTQSLTVTAGPAVAALTAVALPGQPSALHEHSGDGQSATVGTAVPVAPAVVVRDRFGNSVAGAAVRFTVEEGGGTIIGSSAGSALVDVVETSDGLGVARLPAWTLGTTAGPNVLVASAPGLTPVRITATGLPGPAGSIQPASAESQTASTGGSVADPPAVRVRDAYGNPIARLTVQFTVTAGSGQISGGTVETGPDGVARSGAWTLGASPGANTVLATASGLSPVTFSATGVAASPANVSVAGGNQQSAVVNTLVATAPSVLVRDASGHGVPGATVTFTVVSGGGSITGGTAVTDAAGIARVGSWRLGTTAGSNVLSARTGSLPAVSITATAEAGPATGMVRHQGDGQSATVGTAVAIPPAVRATDAHGNPVAGVSVTFAVTAGGGSVSGAIRTTNTSGVATVGGWTLGAATGTNTLSASAAGIASVSFTATATAAPGGGGGGGGGYHIQLVYNTSVSSSQRQAFDAAAARWMELVVGDLPDVNLSVPAGVCGSAQPGFNQTVDDLVIFIEVRPIDGQGGILGSAGPCYIRSQSGLTIAGLISLDAADLANMEQNGTLEEVIMHEMGHVIGVGTLWYGMVTDAGGSDPYFGLADAVAAFMAAGGSGYAGQPVPVENTGGAGTRDAHWRESVLDNELMTGYIGAAGNPLSAITLASLADVGYTVDLSAADGYTLPGAAASQAAGGAPMIRLVEGPPPPVRRVDESGRIR